MKSVVFSDFDGTLTDGKGRMSPLFFDLLNLIESNNSKLVIVSGRSVSWGHFLLTHFPLDYAIMEGGGVILSRKMVNNINVIKEEYLVSKEELKSLDDLENDLKEKIDDCPVSKDSWGRKSDRALEIHTVEDDKKKAEIEEYIQKSGANFSVSNVHLNYWFGDISKYKAIDFFAKNYMKTLDLDECTYFGDALNDQSVFKDLSKTIGVSNIKKYLKVMKYKPKEILEGDHNIGIDGVFNYLKSLYSKEK